MIIRRFRGRTLPEVTREVREAFGPEALILEVKRPRRWWRWLGVGRCEVLAGIEEAALAGARAPRPRPRPAAHRRPLSPGDARQRLVRAVAELCGDGHPLALVPDRPTVCALVGPTGVGKTTTVAKLAARYALGEGRRVALITTDTYRVGAAEQLRIYGEIMAAPVEVVQRPVAIRRALDRFADYDLVLVDTAGRNRLKAQPEETTAVVGLARPDYVLLLLSLSTRREEMTALLEAYRPLAYNRLVVTKVDEAIDASPLLELAAVEGAPLGYLSTGQLVPDDLEVASAENVTAALLGRWRP